VVARVKNQWFGDPNDYFKYDLLIFLAERLTSKQLSVIWMLTENDESPGGQKINYERGAGDEGLFRFLEESLNKGARDVSKLEEYFRGAGHRFEYCPYGARRPFRHGDRPAYFEEIPKENLDDAVVFLDPDTGLEVKSMGDRNGDEYVTYNDVESIHGRMGSASILVIYQHLPHANRNFSLYGKFNELVERLRCPIPTSISDNRIAFIILAKDRKRQSEVREALLEYTRSHLTIYD
jgi:hypothetical protein